MTKEISGQVSCARRPTCTLCGDQTPGGDVSLWRGAAVSILQFINLCIVVAKNVGNI